MSEYASVLSHTLHSDITRSLVAFHLLKVFTSFVIATARAKRKIMSDLHRILSKTSSLSPA